MDEKQLELIELILASRETRIAAGVVIGLILSAFILKWLGALFKDLREAFPAADKDKADKPKKTDEPGADESVEDEGAIDELHMKFIAAQAELIDSQRKLLIHVTGAYTKQKSVDDTIQLRDELLDKLNDELGE